MVRFCFKGEALTAIGAFKVVVHYVRPSCACGDRREGDLRLELWLATHDLLERAVLNVRMGNRDRVAQLFGCAYTVRDAEIMTAMARHA